MAGMALGRQKLMYPNPIKVHGNPLHNYEHTYVWLRGPGRKPGPIVFRDPSVETQRVDAALGTGSISPNFFFISHYHKNTTKYWIIIIIIWSAAFSSPHPPGRGQDVGGLRVRELHRLSAGGGDGLDAGGGRREEVPREVQLHSHGGGGPWGGGEGGDTNDGWIKNLRDVLSTN